MIEEYALPKRGKGRPKGTGVPPWTVNFTVSVEKKQVSLMDLQRNGRPRSQFVTAALKSFSKMIIDGTAKFE